MFVAEVLPENHQMVSVFRDSGFPVTTHSMPGLILVEFPTSLTPGGARARSSGASRWPPSPPCGRSWRRARWR